MPAVSSKPSVWVLNEHATGQGARLIDTVTGNDWLRTFPVQRVDLSMALDEMNIAEIEIRTDHISLGVDCQALLRAAVTDPADGERKYIKRVVLEDDSVIEFDYGQEIKEQGDGV